jgi:hypothetical protein
MNMAKVNCLLRLTQKGNINILQVSKSGPDALLVSEIPILRKINDISEGGDGGEDCCISSLTQIDVVEDINRGHEIERLNIKYGNVIVDMIYPGGRGLPSTVEDCEVPSSSFATRQAKPSYKDKGKRKEMAEA